MRLAHRAELAMTALVAMLLLAHSALGQKPGEIARTIDYELRRLNAQNPSTRARATATLRAISGEQSNLPALAQALPRLRAALADELTIVRWNAAVVLIRCHDELATESAYSTLREDAADPLYSVRLGVIDTLLAIGPTPSALAILTKIAQEDADAEVRDEADRALDSIRTSSDRGDPPEAWQPTRPEETAPRQLAPQIRMPEPAVELRLIEDAVSRLPSGDALKAVAEAIERRGAFQRDEERIPVHELLRPAAAVLLRWIRKRDDAVQIDVRYAAKLLGRAGSEAIQALIPALEDRHAPTRAAATFALMWSLADMDGAPRGSRAGSDVGGALVFMLADESPAVRAWAVTGIGKTAEDRYARDVERLLSDPETRVRAAAARALAELRDREAIGHAIAAMRAMLHDDEPSVRALAIETLGVLGDPPAQADALRLVRSDSARVAYAAATALVALRDRARARVGVAELDDPREWVRQAARIVMQGPTQGGPRRRRWDAPARAAHRTSGDVMDKPMPIRGQVLGGSGWEYFSPVAVDVPIPDARVLFDGPTHGELRTDMRGNFEVAEARPGTYKLTVVADGYLTADVTAPATRSGRESEVPVFFRIVLHRDY